MEGVGGLNDWPRFQALQAHFFDGNEMIFVVNIFGLVDRTEATCTDFAHDMVTIFEEGIGDKSCQTAGLEVEEGVVTRKAKMRVCCIRCATNIAVKDRGGGHGAYSFAHLKRM